MQTDSPTHDEPNARESADLSKAPCVVVIRNDFLSRALAYTGVLLAVAPVVALALASAVFPADEIPVGLLLGVVVGWFVYPVLTLGAVIAARREKRLEATVSVDAASLTLTEGERATVFPRDSLDGGLLFPARDTIPSAAVVYVRRGPTVRLCLEPPQAKALLEKLGFGVGQRSTSVRIVGGSAIAAIGCAGLLGGTLVFSLVLGVVAVLTSGGSAYTWLGYLVPAAFVTVPVLSLIAGRRALVLGNDGVFFGRLRRRFVPYVGVSNVESAGGSLTVKTPHPSPVVLAGSLSSTPTDWQLAARRRIEEERARLAAMKPCSSADVLACGGRSLPVWRRELRDAAMGNAGYRGAAIELEHARCALMHPGAPPDVRLGGAMFCCEVDAVAHTTLIAAAAGATANSSLRRALLSLLHGKLRQREVDAVVTSWADSTGVVTRPD